MLAKSTVKKKTKKPRVIKSEEDKYTDNIRKIFVSAGFTNVKSDGKEIEFMNRKSDIDNIFLFQNILIVCEETIGQASEIKKHLGNKHFLYRHIEGNEEKFVEYLFNSFPELNKLRELPFSAYKLVILYCSFNGVDEALKESSSYLVKFLDIHSYYYFLDLITAIKKSAKYELLDFLGFKFGDVGRQVLLPNTGASYYEGFILPKSASDFANGYKVVTFYIDPATLIEKGFVLRRSGWRDANILYQRPLMPKKISKMREHLQGGGGVFVNNIIVTLPDTAKVELKSGDGISKAQSIDSINRMSLVQISLPNEYNSICIIDGQHRVFAYHEGDDRYESSINQIRYVQNLLATAILYPPATQIEDKINFESKLFVDINSKQSGVRAELIQAIKTIIDRFSTDAIALEVLTALNKMSMLSNMIAVHPYEERTKLRPTTIVSYALKVVVKLGGNDSTFFVWNNPDKDKMAENKNYSLLDEYIKFSATEINAFISAFRQNIVNNSNAHKWKWSSNENGLVRVMVINGLIHCFKLVIKNKKTGNRDYYVKQFEGVHSFDFDKYKGSVWSRMGADLYNKHFA